MSHRLFRLTEQILAHPQLITAEAMAPIAQYLVNRTLDPSLMKNVEEDEKRKKNKSDEEDNDEDDVDMLDNVAFISVEGALSYKPIYTLCGEVGTSYVRLIEQTQEAIEAGAKEIVYSFSSPGGAAMACFTSANEVRQLADEAGVKLTAWIDEGAHSAAYAWACMMDEVVSSPDASVGSIGCIVAMLDDSKFMEKEGFRRVIITSLDGKSPFNEDGSFSDKFLAKVKEDVDRLGLQFAQHVSHYTGLDVEAILALDAQSFHAEKALEVGLVNKVMTPREFLDYVRSNNA